MGEPESEAEEPHGERSQRTIVLGTEVVAAEVDPVLDLLNQWEEFRRRGEEPPADWTAAVDVGLRDELDRRIQRRKRLIGLLDLAGPRTDHDDDPDAPLLSFPGHETLGKIGRGGMGAVYKARDTDLDRVVAIKTIAEGRFATPDHRERFRAEARAVARLRHPNIITIHTIGEHDGQPYLSLEFAEGGSLAERLAGKPMAPREAAVLLETLARAAYAAHRAGVVHRDLKPSNTLLTAEGVPKISDFGLAKLMDADAGRTVTGQVLGSPSYMAPEQAEGRSKQVGPPADVYALGAILYQALTGRPPFLGESQLETLKLVVSNDVVPPCRLRPDVPRDLETICLKCLEKDPARRYADATALAEDLRRHIERRPILARRTGPLEQAWRWCRRKPGLAAASLAATALAVILIVGAAAAAVIFRHQRDRAVAAELKANRSRSEMQAVLEFLQNKVMAAARPEDQEGGLGRDVSLRKALDAAESGIERGFKDQPAVEAAIRAALGETYYYLGDPDPAFRQIERAHALRLQALGPDHADTLRSADDLAHVYLDRGRLAEALSMLTGTLERRQVGLGPDHPDTLTSKNNLATAYQAAGRLAEALPLYGEALARRRATLGPDHPDTLFSMNNLASACREAGRFADALPLYEEALRKRRATLGPDHPETLMSMNNLANFYRELGRYPESIALQAEALRRQEARLGPVHPDTLLSMSNLGLAHQDAGQLAEALPLFEECLKRRRAKLGPDHPETLVSMSNLAGAYQAAGRTAEALPLLEETLRRRRATRGPDHPQTLRSVNALARAYLPDRPGPAEPLLREALAIREQKLPDDWRTFETQSLLGGSLLGQEKYADAEPFVLRGYEGMKGREAKIPAPSRKVLPEALDRIIRLYDAWGKKEKAEVWRKEREPKP
jgi:non-specific serine/threonine protein kinase/serine/threonine-protein kinase